MMSVIKTAIITIIISFISGVLLDYYKNYAPRILCTIMRIKSKTYNNKNIKVYSLIIKNTSNKTLHNLNVNLQGDSDNLKIDNMRIAKGLKYDIEHEGKEYDISIPFLSRDDEFKAKIFLPITGSEAKKPVITLRSPENFKEIGSYKDNSPLSEMLNSLFNHKKTIISIISILIVVYIGILGGEYYVKKADAKINTDNSNKAGVIQNTVSQPKQETKIKSAENKSPVNSKNNNKQADNTKNTSASQNTKNNGSSSESKNVGSSKSESSRSKQEESTTGDSNKNTGDEKGSNESSKNQPASGGNTEPSQNKSSEPGSGTGSNQNPGSSEKPADNSNK